MEYSIQELVSRGVIGPTREPKTMANML
jgi:hypothetical protein